MTDNYLSVIKLYAFYVKIIIFGIIVFVISEVTATGILGIFLSTLGGHNRALRYCYRIKQVKKLICTETSGRIFGIKGGADES